MVATFENCEIFSPYYFSYVGSYKAALRVGNKFIIIIVNWLEMDQTFEHSWHLSFDGS